MTMKKMLPLAALIALISGTAISAAPKADTTPETQRPLDGVEAWSRIFEVVSHPRCANCHVADGVPRWSGPSYGDTPRMHDMYVGGDPNLLLGNPGMMCNTCHMPENSPKLHGPPGADVWHLAPAEMAWWGQSSSDICEQLKDPQRNGGRTLAEIEDHIANDGLVAWGWTPGPGREPAPYSASAVAQFVAIWAAAGAPCDGRQ